MKRCRGSMRADKRLSSSSQISLMKVESLNQLNHFEQLKRIEILEKEVKNLANHMANHLASTPIMLVGWAEISAYCRKKPRTLSRYAKGLAFPAYRLGRHVVGHPYMITIGCVRSQPPR
jgi:hypothetical protein